MEEFKIRDLLFDKNFWFGMTEVAHTGEILHFDPSLSLDYDILVLELVRHGLLKRACIRSIRELTTYGITTPVILNIFWYQ